MSWTDERIERLKAMWTKGSTASQIAEELGGVSRNAVIGKAPRGPTVLHRSNPAEKERRWCFAQRPCVSEPHHAPRGQGTGGFRPDRFAFRCRGQAPKPIDRCRRCSIDRSARALHRQPGTQAPIPPPARAGPGQPSRGCRQHQLARPERPFALADGHRLPTFSLGAIQPGAT
jgi:GcrA cell cycle regulator